MRILGDGVISLQFGRWGWSTTWAQEGERERREGGREGEREKKMEGGEREREIEEREGRGKIIICTCR